MGQQDLEARGVRPETAKLLVDAGYDTPEAVEEAGDEELDAIPNVGPGTIREIRAALSGGGSGGGSTSPEELVRNPSPFGVGDPAYDPRVAPDMLDEEAGLRLAEAHLAGGPPYAQVPTGQYQEGPGGRGPMYIETFEQRRARENAMAEAKQRNEQFKANGGFKAQFGNRLFEVMVDQWGTGPTTFHRGDLVPASEFPEELDLVHAINTNTIRLAVEYEGRGIYSTTRPVESQSGVAGGLRQVGGPSLDPQRNQHLVGYNLQPGTYPGVGGVAAGSTAEQALIRANAIKAPDAPQPPPPGRG
jgi:hypothetical protein